MQTASSATGPCLGYRVLDFTTMVSGPVCTQYLADLGADVVKVEAPGGDPSRITGSLQRKGVDGFFVQLNRNKRSIVIDLRKPEGRELARSLARAADVVVENFRPGVAERLGIGYEELRALNPRLIYVAISGFGPDGPYARHPAYDHILQGLTGMMPAQGGEAGPRMFQSVVVDKASGLAAGSATLAALLGRERSGGEGQRIDVPMLDAYAAYMLPESLAGRSFPERSPGEGKTNQIFRTWQPRDGHIVGIAVQDSQFEGLCRAIEREDLLEDPRFSGIAARFQNLGEMYAILEQEFMKWSSAELVERARRFGAPFGPVHDFEAFLGDPQTLHNGTVFEVEDADGDRTRYLRHAARFSRDAPVFHRPPPALGEHGDEVLLEAGLAEAEIASLREAGVLR